MRHIAIRSAKTLFHPRIGQTGLAALVLTVLLLTPYAVLAAPKAQALKNGEMLARENCAPCHATAEKGESPNAKAPPFRTLSKRYKLEDLEESLAEGITIGHSNANMPHFIFEPEDIGDLIAYLKKLNRQ
jgi:cytochrome c